MELGLKKLDKYILSEFWLPLVGGAGIITGVWLGIDKFKEVFKLLAKSGASISTGFVILGLEIPQILAITLPISILLASFLVFQKLSGQSEVIAIRASGISFTRMMRPVFYLGVIGVALCFMLGEFIVPYTGPVAKKIYALALYKDPISTKNYRGFSYFEKDSLGFVKRIFYVRRVKKGDILKDIVILDFTKEDISMIHNAKKGKWDPERGGWVLYDGSSSYIKSSANKKEVDIKNLSSDSMHLVSNFETTLIPSSLNPNEILKKMTKIHHLNFVGLHKFIKLHGDDEYYTDRLNEIKTKFHNKFSYPASCLFLAIIGACLGIVGRRRVINWGYIALGLIVFVFYMSHTIFDSFGASGKIIPMLSSWIPTIIIALIALVAYFYRAER